MISPTAPTKQQVARYFNGIRGNTGHQQLVPHLKSLPRWWSLRDSKGQTPLMHAMEAKGMSVSMFESLISTAQVRNTLAVCDHRGRNFWYHLLLHQARQNKTDGWVDLVKPHVPLQASPLTGRGICTDLMLRAPGRQWSYFFPGQALGRDLQKLPGSSPKTWLGADEFQAQEAMEWLLGVRKLSMGERACRALSWMAGGSVKERQMLARPMRAGVMFMEFLYSLRTDLARQELDDGMFIALPGKVRAQLEKEISLRPEAVQARVWEVLRINDQRVLEQHEAKLTKELGAEENTHRPVLRL